ncbi:hypothetical protein [Actinokineospora fastidiosa]|uniref:FHA domain-containing protein n=1 Tax=Actinokineospora fastidiosa TaxID=1816 RepID=A0A918GS82_9PSEU|nr:hypothetical protein [Actinokineospora fastidiosa]GGS54787.1 hypothetical protein GCM10010171_57420 [Actinokineospora fastidiosa]
MDSIDIGWALVGKKPGLYEEYSVIAASAGPFSPRQFEKIVSSSTPGNPPPPHENGPSALPWVWFDHPQIRGVTYVGIAIREWSPHFDATNRPIVFTRYFCVSLDDMLAAGVSYADFYETVREETVEWECADPLSQPTRTLPVRRGGKPAALATESAVAAAARLLEGAVVLLNGPGEMTERLNLLDAVARMLPAGAKAWLFTGTWSDNTSLNLSFGRRARDGDVALDLRTGHLDRSHAGDPSPYERALLQLIKRKGEPQVTEHLARQTDLRTRDPWAAEAILQDLDLLKVAVEAARAGTLKPEMLRKLHKSGDLDFVDAFARRQLLEQYLAVATPADVIRDAALLRAHWVAKLAPRLEEFARRQQKAARWTEEEIVGVAEVARRLGLAEQVMRAVVGMDTPERAEVVLAVDILGRRPEWLPVLGSVVADAKVTAVGLAARLAKHDGGLDGELAAHLDRAGENTVWQRVAGPYRKALTGPQGMFTNRDVAQLGHVDEAPVFDLVAVVHEARPERIGEVLDAVLVWLRDRIDQGLPHRWTDLSSLLSERHLPAADLLRYCTGLPPLVPLSRGRDYRRALAECALSDGILRATRIRFIDAVAGELGTGWSEQIEFDEVLLFFQWVAGIGGREQIVSRPLVDTIAGEILTNRALLDSPAVQLWQEYLANHQEMRRLFEERRAGIRRAVDVPWIANEIPKWGSSSSEALRRFLAKQKIPPDAWGAILVEVMAGQVANRVAQPHELVARLVNALLDHGFGSGPPEAVARPVAFDSAVQLDLAAFVLLRTHPHIRLEDGATDLARKLRAVQETLGEVAKSLEKKEPGLIKKAINTVIRSSDGERREGRDE